MSEQPPQNPEPGWTPPGGTPPPPAPPGGPATPPPMPPPAAPPAPDAPPAPPAPPAAPAAPAAPTGAPQPPPYDAPPNPYYAGQAGPPPGKGMAITAFVLSLIPIFITQIIAIILSIITIKRVGRNEAAGKGLAVAALVISVVLLIAMVIGGVLLANEDSKLKDHRKAGEGEIYSSALRTGDCLPKFPGLVLKGTIDITSCSKSHGGEVFGVEKIDVGDSSTKTSRSNDSQAACIKAYQDYIGGSNPSPQMQITYFVPQPSTLNDFDKAICVIGTGGQSTGSLKGTGGS